MVEKDEAIFRSAEMSLVQMYIPQEIARDAVYTLGNTGLVQFRDLNSKVRAFQRTFVNEIRKLDNVQRQHRYFVSLLKKYNLPLYEEIDDDELSHRFTLPPGTSTIDDHVENAALIEERLTQLVDASEQLELQKTDLEQFRYVLQAGDEFFSKTGDLASIHESLGEEDEQGLLENGGIPRSVSFVTGVIPRSKINTLEQILWRVLRGNLFFKHVELPEHIYDAKAKDKIAKNAFIVFSHGDLIMQRIKKIAESLDANLYKVDEVHELRSQELNSVNSRLSDLYTVLETTTTTLETELYAIAKELDSWARDISKEKAVYETLNLFDRDANRKTLIAEGWIPKDDLES